MRGIGVIVLCIASVAIPIDGAVVNSGYKNWEDDAKIQEEAKNREEKRKFLMLSRSVEKAHLFSSLFSFILSIIFGWLRNYGHNYEAASALLGR